MGRTFPDGEEGGVAALHFLANQPSTHRFLATKLVRYFVADDPPPAAVRQIEGVLRDTGGNLGSAAEALITLEAAWEPASKLRTPQDFVVAALRALDLPDDERQTVPLQGILAGLGQPFQNAPQPNGWPDRAGDWATPEAMMRRIDWAYAMSGRVGTRDVSELAAASLGPLVRAETLQAVQPRRLASRRHDLVADCSGIPEAMMLQLSRRAALLGLTSAVTLGRASLALAAAPTEQRFVVVILRGALDGLSAVVPHGDPALAGLRAELVPEGLLDLGGFYGLHPSLANLHTMYGDGELLPVHAVAGPTRVRSHFEAQDCLESGADHRMTSGWLNRAVSAMPADTGNRSGSDAMAIGVSVPLLLRGPATVGNWAPHGIISPPADLYTQIAALNQADRVTGPAIVEGLSERGFTGEVLSADGTEQPAGNRYAFPALARAGRRNAARS